MLTRCNYPVGPQREECWRTPPHANRKQLLTCHFVSLAAGPEMVTVCMSGWLCNSESRQALSSPSPIERIGRYTRPGILTVDKYARNSLVGHRQLVSPPSHCHCG